MENPDIRVGHDVLEQGWGSEIFMLFLMFYIFLYKCTRMLAAVYGQDSL